MILRISSLKAKTILGVYEYEKSEPTEVLINIEIIFDGNKAAISDDLSDTIDYDLIEQKIITHLRNRSYLLIESLLSDILDILMSYDKVEQAKAEVKKFSALKCADFVSMEDVRTKNK